MCEIDCKGELDRVCERVRSEQEYDVYWRGCVKEPHGSGRVHGGVTGGHAKSIEELWDGAWVGVSYHSDL